MTTTYEYSRLALAVYSASPDDITMVSGGTPEFTVEGTSADGNLAFVPETSGFFGAYYKDAAGNIVITYRGTEISDLGDWVADAGWACRWTAVVRICT